MDNEFSCDEVSELISSYYDKEVSTEEKELIEGHLLQCPECKQKLLDLNNLSRLIKTSNYNKQLEYEDFPTNVQKLKNCLKSSEECHFALENFSAYYDRELSSVEMKQISRHLLACKYCRKDYESYKLAMNAVKEYLNKPLNKNFEVDKTPIQIGIIKAKQVKAAVYVAAVVVLAVLTFFSVGVLNPQSVKNAAEQDEKKENDSFYVDAGADEVFLTKGYLASEEGIISVLYEKY